MPNNTYTNQSFQAIHFPVDHVAAFKNCCRKAGIFDGELRNYFFSERELAPAGRLAPAHQAEIVTVALRSSFPQPTNRPRRANKKLLPSTYSMSCR